MPEPSLLAAIRAQPDDDSVRLVYADWLDEQGDAERASYIRYAVVRDRAFPTGSAWTGESNWCRECDHETRWLGPLKHEDRSAHFQRGFLKSINLTTLDFMRHASWLFAHEPIAKVILSAAVHAVPPGLFDAAEWANVTDVEISVDTAAPLEAFARSERFGGLRSLAIYSPHPLPMRACRWIAEGGFAANLRHLSIERCLPDPEGLALLVGALSRAVFESLRIDRGMMSREHLAVLTEHDQLAGLRSLSLTNAGLGAWAGVGLASARNRNGLQLLDIGFVDHRFPNWIGDAGLAALAEEGHLTGLRELYLLGNDVTDAGVRSLAAGGRLGALESLDLRDNRCGNGAVRELANSERLPSLRSLTLGCSMLHNSVPDAPLGEDILSVLAETPFPDRAEHLSVSRVKLRGAVAAAFDRWNSPAMRSLALPLCGLADQDVRALVDWPSAVRLRELDLAAAEMSEDTARRLLSAPLRELKALRLSRHNIPEELQEAFDEQFADRLWAI